VVRRQFTAAEREKSRKVATVLIAALLMVMLFCTLNWFFTTVLL
jgi:hypothetical protein